MLSIMSIVFDLIFMFQHYVLYREKVIEDKRRRTRLESVYFISLFNHFIIANCTSRNTRKINGLRK